ncbi:MAG: hypothetical protein IH991_12635, partial [Planctomycetes bacterium]|nr:hypothetical protein [Planctomycetota bacterium]
MNRAVFYYPLLFSTLLISFPIFHQTVAQENTTTPVPTWISALDKARVKRLGPWRESRFRYAAASHLMTDSTGAALEFRFRGSGIVLRLGSNAVPAYGAANLGSITVTVDGKNQRTIAPRAAPREFVIARGLGSDEHVLRVEHQKVDAGAGCRIEGFYVLEQPAGELQFVISGEENAFLVDARAIFRHGDRVIRNRLVRNWLTGQCSLAGLPPGKGYTLEISAAGWQTARVGNVSIEAARTTELAPIFLRRDEATRIVRFRFPALNRPAIRKPGQTFRARFLGFQATIDEVRLRRAVGPAVISRRLNFTEDKVAAYYYDREVIASLPDDMPPGVYDLQVQVTGGRRTGFCLSPRSVHV